MDQSNELIQMVASRCYITSTDELIKKRLETIVNNAIISVKSLIGISEEEDFDFLTPSKESELFLNYCMYRWNNRTAKEFEANYINDIISTRSKYEIKYHKQKEEEQNG